MRSAAHDGLLLGVHRESEEEVGDALHHRVRHHLPHLLFLQCLRTSHHRGAFSLASHADDAGVVARNGTAVRDLKLHHLGDLRLELHPHHPQAQAHLQDGVLQRSSPHFHSF